MIVLLKAALALVASLHVRDFSFGASSSRRGANQYPDLHAHSQSANYYSNDEELWFDLGYTFSLNLQTLQLYWVISMGGDTTLRNKKCQFLAGDTFWNALNSDKP